MIHEGDCLTVLKGFEAETIDSLITDPPAGISFMGKEWDSNKGGPKQWIAWMTQVMTECLRVLKPGAHGLVWAIPRTSHWTATALEDAGFEIRDVVTHLFGSGFPKSMDISKAIDKSLPSTAEAKLWQGFGTALKPASEHWILVRKPISEKTVAANVLKHGCGGINIDASRISNSGARRSPNGADGKVQHSDHCTFEDVTDRNGSGDGMNILKSEYICTLDCDRNTTFKPTSGRFPANLLLSHNPDCVEVGTKKVKTGKCSGNTSADKSIFGMKGNPVCYADSPDGTEIVSAFECTPGCAVAELDRQSGVLKSGDLKKDQYKDGKKNQIYGKYGGFEMPERKGDSGGASRFFYCAKASKSEKNAGCEGLPEGFGKRNFSQGMEYKLQADGSKTSIEQKAQANTHPTVKPLKLMTYLTRMITPPGGTVLDPFLGSGSTGVAATLQGYDFIGIEQNPEYLEIAKKRIFNALPEFKKQVFSKVD